MSADSMTRGGADLPVRALGLYSGGLDSLLAVALLQHQGVAVEALHFRTGFSKRSSRIALDRCPADQPGFPPVTIVEGSSEFLGHLASSEGRGRWAGGLPLSRLSRDDAAASERDRPESRFRSAVHRRGGRPGLDGADPRGLPRRRPRGRGGLVVCCARCARSISGPHRPNGTGASIARNWQGCTDVHGEASSNSLGDSESGSIHAPTAAVAGWPTRISRAASGTDSPMETCRPRSASSSCSRSDGTFGSRGSPR